MSKKKGFNKIARFSGMGIQMGVIIYLGSCLGQWLDTKYINVSSKYTKICTLVAVFLSLYTFIKQANKLSD